MILSFKKQFVNKIKRGTKIHTIREDKTNRWKVGNKIHFATGIRTKHYNQFKSGLCKGIQKFVVKRNSTQIGIWIDDKLMFSKDGIIWNGTTFLETLAKNDGFKNEDDFLAWFNADFEGKIIHWANHKYD